MRKEYVDMEGEECLVLLSLGDLHGGSLSPFWYLRIERERKIQKSLFRNTHHHPHSEPPSFYDLFFHAIVYVISIAPHSMFMLILLSLRGDIPILRVLPLCIYIFFLVWTYFYKSLFYLAHPSPMCHPSFFVWDWRMWRKHNGYFTNERREKRKTTGNVSQEKRFTF